MATPTPPTPALIVAEGLQKAGYESGTTKYGTLLTRGEQTWMEEIKYDIWERAKKLRSFQTEANVILTNGVSSYSMPTDFSSLIGFDLLSGSASGTAQTGTTTSLTFAAADTHSSTSIVGLSLLLTGGTGSAQSRQITAYDDSTKVATVTPAWTTTPDSTSTYLIVSQEQPLEVKPIWDQSKSLTPSKGTPTTVFTEGDDTLGTFITDLIPDQTYGVRVRYYLDITLADTTSQVMVTIYRKYRMTFMQGIIMKAYQYMDDDRYASEFSVYQSRLGALVAREQYGQDLNDLQSTVTDRI